MRRSAIAVALAGLLVPASASGATQLGQTALPNLSCGNQITILQEALTAGASYEVPPGGGVITAWQYEANATSGITGKLKVLRAAASAGSYVVLAQSEPAPLIPSTLNRNTTRLPVVGGEIIGLTLSASSPAQCAFSTASGTDIVRFVASDAPVGSNQSYSPAVGARVDVAATLEPDADNDRYGDETQDCAPGDPGLHDDCSPPDTTITSQPKAKTMKKQATFEFTSSEPGSSFECSLNGAPFTSCTSPLTVKGKKGKNSFAVRAKDAAGNVDATPATYSWKVKKKKRK